MNNTSIDTLQRLLTTYAYNILGSVEDAQDVVQDAYLKFMQADTSAIENKKAYMVRTVINLSINAKKRQQKIRAAYPGEWFPEPVATERADSFVNRKEILSYSLMVLLEKLNAKQRAVFILKEAFDYDHEEIASVLNITTEHSRKLLSRAKLQLQKDDDNDTPVVSMDYVDKYLSVIHNADMQQLEEMLYNDIVSVSDGGGKVAAAINPVLGKEAVIKFITGIYKKFYSNTAFKKTFINHQPALLFYHEGRLVTCQIFSFREDRIDHVYLMRNPDKLKLLEKNFL